MDVQILKYSFKLKLCIQQIEEAAKKDDKDKHHALVQEALLYTEIIELYKQIKIKLLKIKDIK